MFSVGQKVETPIEVYRKTLSRHKQLIQNNKYAQELEKKYNKFRHKSQQESVSINKVHKTPHLWPIHSTVFTQVLRNKLNSVLKVQTPKASTRPVTRIKKKLAHRSLNSARRSQILQTKTSIALIL